MFFSLLPLALTGALASPLSQKRALITPQHGPEVNTDDPRFVVYSDHWLTGGEPPTPEELNGWTTFALCFWTTDAQDLAQAWTELTAEQRTEIKANYTAANVNLIVSAFGSTATPTSSGSDPVTVADDLAAFVVQYDLDGVDVDYEDFNAMNDGTAVDWIVSFHNELRAKLPSPDYILSHAPVAPWFTTNKTQYPPTSASGLPSNYLDVHNQVGDTIDWYNTQFYNQGTDEYTDCDSLLNQSLPPWSNASLFEIISNGVPANKLLIGKPAGTTDATNGYMDPATLHTCVTEARAKSWDAGLMVWEWPDGNSSTWVETVWGSS